VSVGAPAPAEAHRVAASASVVRGQARTEMDASARRRIADGVTASEQASSRLEGRTMDLLRAAVRAEALARSEPAATTGASGARGVDSEHGAHPSRTERQETLVAPGAGVAGPGPLPEARVEQAMALVERIEHFVRSGRAALALTLRGSLPGRLELQQAGRGAISIRLSSPRPPSRSELGELRQALEARGLSIRSLETRKLTASSTDACSPCP